MAQRVGAATVQRSTSSLQARTERGYEQVRVVQARVMVGVDLVDRGASDSRTHAALTVRWSTTRSFVVTTTAGRDVDRTDPEPGVEPADGPDRLEDGAPVVSGESASAARQARAAGSTRSAAA